MATNSNNQQRGRGGGGGGGRRRFYSRPRTCQFCSDKSIMIDYKKIDLLKQFTSREGRIRPRRQTGNCAKHQRKIAIAIKQARHIALLPFTDESLS